jgi:hypothetical protein
LLARNQGVLIIALGLEFGDNLSQRGVYKVHRPQNAGTGRGIVIVFDVLPCNGGVLEVAAENCWHPSDFDPLEVMEAFTRVMPSIQLSQAFI